MTRPPRHEDTKNLRLSVFVVSCPGLFVVRLVAGWVGPVWNDFCLTMAPWPEANLMVRPWVGGEQMVPLTPNDQAAIMTARFEKGGTATGGRGIAQAPAADPPTSGESAGASVRSDHQHRQLRRSPGRQHRSDRGESPVWTIREEGTGGLSPRSHRPCRRWEQWEPLESAGVLPDRIAGVRDDAGHQTGYLACVAPAASSRRTPCRPRTLPWPATCRKLQWEHLSLTHVMVRCLRRCFVPLLDAGLWIGTREEVRA